MAVLLVLLVAAACRPDRELSTKAPFVVDTFATTATVPFQRPVDGVVLPDGRLAVLDFEAGRVFLLGGDGSLEQTLGRPGAGPGELKSARGITLRGDTLAILNDGNGRLELFLPGQTFSASRPLPANVSVRNATLLAADSTLAATGGEDSALAVLQTAAGTPIVRFAKPIVPNGPWDFTAMRQEILAGKVPAGFRNHVVQMVDPAGPVWLLLHTEGRVERYSRTGVRQLTVAIPDRLIAPVRAEFFAANAAEKRPGVLRSYALAYNGVAQDQGLWLLLAYPDSLAPVLLHIDAAGVVAEEQELPGAEGARYLIPAGRDTFYAIHPTEGVVFRLRRRQAPSN